MAIMKNENWAAWPKLHAGVDDKLGIKFACPNIAKSQIEHDHGQVGCTVLCSV